MAGLVEEGEDVMSDGKEKDDVPADLALIGLRNVSSITTSPRIRRPAMSPCSFGNRISCY